MKNSAPVLFITFSRPECAIVTLDAIRAIKPGRLYFYSNAARSERPEEIRKNAEIRSWVSKIDWDCDLRIFFRDEYVPVEVSITSAISWAFETTEKLIILEEDCVPTEVFVEFVSILLEKYKDDQRIAMISGNQYTPMPEIKDDYIFTKYGHIWGWATWRRAWDQFDMNLPYLRNDIESNHLEKIGLRGKELKYFMKKSRIILNLIENGSMNTWDSQFGYFRLRNQLLSIAPRVNLTSNIGTTSSRTGISSDVNQHYHPSDINFVLKTHPLKIELNTAYDNHHFSKHINKKKPLYKRILKKLFKLKLS